MHRTVPGFRTLHFGDVVDLHLLDAERDNNAVIAEQLAELLVERFGLADGARLRFALHDRGGDGGRADQAGVPARPGRRRARSWPRRRRRPGVPAASST